MKIYYMCTYYSQWAHENVSPRSQEQWDAFKFCRAVKKGIVNGSLTVPLVSGAQVINSTNVGLARSIFGQFITNRLSYLKLNNPILVPIPSKDGLIEAQSFRSLEMLKESIPQTYASRIIPAVRFSQPLQPANAGGPRGRMALSPYMRLVLNIPDGEIVLIDDIITSGGTLSAVCDLLSTVGRAPVAAIVCGHTVSDSLTRPFGFHDRELDIAPILF